ncbi:hypothetical protein AGMMS50268_06350 [Spirochaetia bacterium]|nr:hypothetical protein AGMMS50268_06350 [Spirochaetia bacterium]
MVKSATMYSYELDSPEAAIQDIKTQLKGVQLLKNSVGILMCDPEFIETGVYAAVSESLPFPVVGTTTMTQAVNGQAGMFMLTVMVLTSDDAFFETGYTEELSGGCDIAALSKAAYQGAAAKLPEKAKLIFAFPPLIPDVAGDQYVDAFEALCPGTPVFGTLAVDDSITFSHSFTFHSGESSKTRMGFILAAGNISPRFLIATMSDDNKLPYTGEITRSEGPFLKEINNVLTKNYFESIGFAKDGKLDEGLQFVPFLIDFKKRADYDGVPVVRALIHLDENGYGICRGYMYENSIFTITNPSKEDVLKTSLELMDKLDAAEERQATIIFSCVVRRMLCTTEPLAEARMISDKLSPGSPFMLAYAGGEICPTSSTAAQVTNRFHNYSIIACVL